MSSQKKDETNLSLCMGFSYEIEAATIALDEATIFKKLKQHKSCNDAKKPSRECVALSEFLFCLFSRFHCRCKCVKLASSVTTQNNS